MFETQLQEALSLYRSGRFADAAAAYGRILGDNPTNGEALFHRGALNFRSGKLLDALSDYDRLTLARPSFAQGWRNRAAVLEALGRLEDSLACVAKVAELEPKDAGAQLKSADLLLQLNRLEEAEPYFARYLAAVPGDAGAWNRRGIALAETKRKEEALFSFGKAVALAPGNGDFRFNRANALFESRRYAEAADEYEKTLEIVPGLPFAEGYLLQCRLRCCDWGSVAPLKQRIEQGLAAGKPVIDPLGNLAVSASPAGQLQCARIWASQEDWGAPRRLWNGERYTHGKIRIAYLSADFRLHPVSYLVAGVFEHHDRSKFEVTCVSFTPPGENGMRARIEKACDSFHDVFGATEEAAAELIRSLEIDIAVDLMGYTDGARTGILARRPAPVQASWLGFPSTQGLPHIDYVLADRTVVPDEDRRHFSEQVAYLPDCYLPGDDERPISDTAPSRSNERLPERGFVFASFNDCYKIGPEMFGVWMRLLAAMPSSVLWLGSASPEAMANLRREAAARGIEGERIIFAARAEAMEDHLARLRLADLMLDTLPYNAHASASDALWAGVPMVTCEGTAFAGRVAASALRAACLPQLIAHSLSEYEELALRLAREPQALAAIRQRLLQDRKKLPLFDTHRFARHLESAYRTMWTRAQRGEKPSHFAVATLP